MLQGLAINVYKPGFVPDTLPPLPPITPLPTPTPTLLSPRLVVCVGTAISEAKIFLGGLYRQLRPASTTCSWVERESWITEQQTVACIISIYLSIYLSIYIYIYIYIYTHTHTPGKWCRSETCNLHSRWSQSFPDFYIFFIATDAVTKQIMSVNINFRSQSAHAHWTEDKVNIYIEADNWTVSVLTTPAVTDTRQIWTTVSSSFAVSSLSR